MIRAERKRGRYPLKGNTKHLSAMIFVFTVIAIAYACRMLAKFDIGGPVVNHIRTALYLLLFSLWGFSLDRRIIQRQALHCLRLTAALILLWLILRTLKYSVVTDLTAARYVWYLYYLPMLFLPLLGVYIALSMGKPEDYRLSRKTGMLLIVPAVLFLLVITNDLHQQVVGDHQQKQCRRDDRQHTGFSAQAVVLRLSHGQGDIHPQQREEQHRQIVEIPYIPPRRRAGDNAVFQRPQYEPQQHQRRRQPQAVQRLPLDNAPVE